MHLNENEFALANMSVGDVLDYSIAVYKRNFKKVTLLALIFYVPFVFLYAAVISYYRDQLVNSMGTNNSTNVLADFQYIFLAYIVIFLVVGLAFIAYSLIIKSTMDASIIKIIYSDVVERKERKIKDVIKESFRKLPGLMGNKALYYLVLFGIGLCGMIALGIVLGITAFATLSLSTHEGNTGGFGTGAFILIGTILIGYIGLALFISFFAVKYSFGIHAVVIENKRAAVGISRSAELTKKSFWHVFMSYFLGGLIFFTVPLLLSFGSQALISVNKWLYIVIYVCAQVIGAIIYPYIVTLTTMLFINLKIRKEGLDLEVKVDKLLEAQESAKIDFNDGEVSDV